MENNGGNNATNASTNLRQQQQQQIRDATVVQKLQDQHQQQQQQQQQTTSNSSNNSNENQQQFCLRWHNHQTSLLSTLPILLDQSHLTDVTISAEGRTLRAHRVVLSACSSFFLEIFRTLETTHHPVIIIPGASFTAIVALLTFMYSGEVNVYEEQIPMLLSLAETLGIKGLADVHNNLQKFTKISQDKQDKESNKEDVEENLATSPPSPSQPTHSASGNFSLPQTPSTSTSLNTNLAAAAAASSFNPLLSSGLSSKFPSPLENLFLKSLQFYPNLMHQPLNFSQAALSKTTELLSKYQQQCNLYQSNLSMNPKDLLSPLMHAEDMEGQMAKRFCAGLSEKKSSMQQNQINLQQQQQQQKDIKRLDKIVENLRGVSGANAQVASASSLAGVNKPDKPADNTASPTFSTQLHTQLTPLSIKTSLDNYTTTNPASALMQQAKSSMFNSPTATETATSLHSQLPYNISAEDQLKLQQHLDKYAQTCARATMEAAAAAATANENLKNEAARTTTTVTTPQSPQAPKAPSNSKLYATCFICHKQLSNQYNLRVHLETHQNVRYACNVCSHVSRSKDALRKHVSYRHPGAPSPCETEARRKRANKVLATQLNVANFAQNSPSSGEVTPTSPNTLQHFQNVSATTSNTTGNELNCAENTHAAALTAAQLTSAYQMFMPNQFHLAAVAANAAQQQQQQQQAQQQCSPNNMKSKDFTTTTLDNNENSAANSEANSKSATSPTTTLTTQASNSTTLTTNTEFQTTTDNNNTNSGEQNRISPSSLNP